jgi:hypothetical protein
MVVSGQFTADTNLFYKANEQHRQDTDQSEIMLPSTSLNVEQEELNH